MHLLMSQYPKAVQEIINDLKGDTSEPITSQFSTQLESFGHNIDDIPDDWMQLVDCLGKYEESVNTLTKALLESEPSNQATFVEALSKLPNALDLYENISQSRIRLWTTLSTLFLQLFADSENIELAEKINSCDTMKDILDIWELNQNQDISAFISLIDSRFFEDFTAQQKQRLFNIFKSIFVCTFLSLHQQAKLFTEYLTKELLEYQNEHHLKLSQDLIKHQGRRELSIETGKVGAKVRHEASRKTKDAAIKLYLQGDFKNPSQAAEKLFPQVKALGKKYGFYFTGDFNGSRRLYEWLREAKKIHSSP